MKLKDVIAKLQEELRTGWLRLDDRADADDTESATTPDKAEKATLPKGRKRVANPFKMSGSPTEVAFVDDGNVDDPAIFRRATPVELES